MSLAALKPEEVARLHADAHPGYELVSFDEVGLPFFQLRIDAQILEHKPIDPFAEVVLGAVENGLNAPADMQAMLGLGQRLLDTTLVALVAKDLLALSPDGDTLHITLDGEQVLSSAIQIQPESAQLRVVFDPLLREVVEPYGDYLEPRDIRDRGIIEIGLPTKLVPALHHLDVRDVERVIKQMGVGREQTSDVVALRAMRRFRVFRLAVALVFQAEGARNVAVDFALDGQISDRHTAALAELGVKKKLGIREAGLDPALEVLAEALGPQVAKIASDPERNRKLRVYNKAIRQKHNAELKTGVTDGQTSDALEKRAKRAQDVLENTPVKSVETYEHPQYLADAFENSLQRIVVISPWLRRAVMNDSFMQRLEEVLEMTVDVYIGWGISADEDTDPNADRWVLRRLKDLSTRFSNLHVSRLGNTHAKILISDSRYIIVTSFNWLSFRGDPRRTFRDERGTQISQAVYVDREASKWIARVQGATDA